jgi:aarF domain-containing kinase
MRSGKKTPAEIPAGAPRRLARIGAAGAGVLARTALAGVRKAGAGAAERQAIDTETREANALQIFDAMGRLKGAFLKVGQLLSQQSHSLPEAYVRRLAELQRQAPPMHGTLARIQFRNELGRPPEEVFAAFEREPFAAASLGQVHAARLVSGEALAVKIQYPGIERSITSDFAILRGLLRTARLGGHLPEIGAAVDEVERHLAQEVDYVREAGAMEEFARLLAGDGCLVVPRVFRDLSSRRVLTMERLSGQHLSELLAENPPQAERDRLASVLLDLFSRQTLVFGLLHADPHPGNFLFAPDGRIGLLDFGCVKRFAPGFLAVHRRLLSTPVEDEAALVECYAEIGLFDPAAERAGEQRDLLLALQRLDAGKYHQDQPFDFGEAGYLRALSSLLQDLLRAGLTHPEFVLYTRTKLGLYNLFHQLAARVDCRRIVEPYL